MASSSEKSTKVDLTTCSICFETFKTPKYFPCLHSFCEGCIKTYITTTFMQTKAGINCPVCRMYVSKPENISIEEWSSKLPTNHILVSLIDMNQSNSDEKLCTACSRENETESACSWCINCAEFLCKACDRSHRRNKYTNTHNLVDLSNPQTSEMMLNKADIQCTEHPDKNVEVYCRNHSTICCMTCAFLKHRYCKNVGSVQDAAQEMKKSKEAKSLPDSLNEFKNSLDAMLQYTTKNIHDFDKDMEKMKSDVETLFTKLSNHLSQLKSHIMSEVSKTNVKYAPPAQFLQAMAKLMEQRLILEEFVNEESQKIKEIRGRFYANKKLLEIEKVIQEFGEVSISRTNIANVPRSTNRDVTMGSVVPTLSSKVNIPSAVTGVTLLGNGQVLMSHYSKQTIELRDHQCLSVLSSLSVPGNPCGIEMTSDTEGTAAMPNYGLIIFNVQNNQITKIKEIKTNVNGGFIYRQRRYYVGSDKNIAIFDNNHRKVLDISVDNNVGYMAVRDDTSLCYTVWGGAELHCITIDGTPVFKYTHGMLRNTIGVTVDHASYIYVCDYCSMNVHQLTHDGKLQRIILDNLPSSPRCISFNKHGDKAVIGCEAMVLLYELI
ncbi:hypothetical protein FSP39_014867 [Pinctada imbricata]|uniref:TRIM56 n=1 Tax=Pinctada imbricata TaxID=66713 RepID=A0AA89BUU0_PINIB|nr:hypothetical protein FSP39_014867 [Pinctada imbricata]